jgi:hypothetical protein
MFFCAVRTCEKKKCVFNPVPFAVPDQAITIPKGILEFAFGQKKQFIQIKPAEFTKIFN